MRVERAFKDAAVAVGKLLDALANNLNFSDNMQAKLLGPITTPGVADTEFTVEHKLGVVPTRYVWNVDKNAVIYDSRRVNWTSSQMFLKSSAASATLYLIVMV